jgi:hypothetical protein
MLGRLLDAAVAVPWFTADEAYGDKPIQYALTRCAAAAFNFQFGIFTRRTEMLDIACPAARSTRSTRPSPPTRSGPCARTPPTQTTNPNCCANPGHPGCDARTRHSYSAKPTTSPQVTH